LRRLRLAALADEDGKTLEGALLTLRTAFEPDSLVVPRAASA
jgi:hypothetical protein